MARARAGIITTKTTRLKTYCFKLAGRLEKQTSTAAPPKTNCGVSCVSRGTVASLSHNPQRPSSVPSKYRRRRVSGMGCKPSPEWDLEQPIRLEFYNYTAMAVPGAAGGSRLYSKEARSLG